MCCRPRPPGQDRTGPLHRALSHSHRYFPLFIQRVSNKAGGETASLFTGNITIQCYSKAGGSIQHRGQTTERPLLAIVAIVVNVYHHQKFKTDFELSLT